MVFYKVLISHHIFILYYMYIIYNLRYKITNDVIDIEYQYRIIKIKLINHFFLYIQSNKNFISS